MNNRTGCQLSVSTGHSQCRSYRGFWAGSLRPTGFPTPKDQSTSDERNSLRRGTARRATSVESCQLLQNCTKN